MLVNTIPDFFWVILSGCAGLILGSFFNVIIFRVPRGESIVFPGSHCPSCQKTLKSIDNIPVFSWIFLGGKCRYCSTPISLQYPIIEALTGVVSSALTIIYLKTSLIQELPHFLSLFTLSLFTIPFIVLDNRHNILPNLLTYSGAAIGLILSFIPGGINISQSAAGFFFTSIGLWLFGFIIGKILRKDAMGLGDVKLVAMTGALFGFPTALLGIITGSFLGLLLYLPLMFLGKKSGNPEIPFGPYICVGTLTVSLLGISFETILTTLY